MPSDLAGTSLALVLEVTEPLVVPRSDVTARSFLSAQEATVLVVDAHRGSRGHLLGALVHLECEGHTVPFLWLGSQHIGEVTSCRKSGLLFI